MLSSAVRQIRRQQLGELRGLPSPPPAVRLALESICVLMGEPVMDWKGMRSTLMRDNFISSIINFKTENITYVVDQVDVDLDG